MKKSLSLLFALMLTLAVNAQVFLDQTFDGSSLPSGWSFGGEGKNSMIINGSNFCGGSPNEVAIAGSPQGLPDFDGAARIISPTCDLTGIGEFLFSFKHTYATSYASFKVAIAVSDDNASTWTDLWSQNFSGEGGGEIRQTVSIPEEMDESSIKFCVYIEGDSYVNNNTYLWIWAFDDIRALVQKNYDIAVTEIATSDIIGIGENSASFVVKNNGSKAITAFTATYQYEGYEEVTQDFTTYMAPFTTKTLTFNEATNITGFDPLKLTVSISTVNNQQDENEADNNIEKQVSIAMGTTQRIPMIEHFSSSSCPPCVSVNASMKTLTNNNPGKYTYVKYSTSWPSPTDSHYIAESNTRVQYYQVSGVPAIFTDGMDKGTPINQSTLDSRYNTPALADIRGAFNIDGNTLNVTADFMSFADMSNVRAFVTVNEKLIEKNGANGEREFRHILLKMLSGATGTALNIKAGEYQRLTFTHDMSTTKMQDINDLEVALWLQNLETGEVFNSHYAYEYTDHCYPVQNLELNVENGNLSITFEAPEQGTPTGYNVYNNGTMIAEKTTELSHNITANEVNVISVVAVYADDKTSVPVVKIDGTMIGVEETAQAENTFSIYPNPARDYVRVSGEDINTISVYNCLGALVERVEAKGNTTSISTSSYNTGVYFITVEQNNGVSTTQKMVVTH